MGQIPRETIEQVLDATDLVDLIGSYFPLKRAGSAFKCNCPFHNEKTPSFNIDPVRQYYKCFGCGESGNALSFLMNYENLPFVDAVKKLANRAGISIIEEAYDPESDRKRRHLTRLKELNNKTARFFHDQLLTSPDAEHARQYLKSRGFKKSTTDSWLIGWAPKNSRLFLNFAREQGFKGREILDAGLGGLKNKDQPRSGLWVKWYDQLTFPIRNDYGDVVGFSARILRPDDPRGKYINTNDSPLFHKSKLLFALDQARRPIGREKFALICEGQVDAIVLHEAGFENTIAPLGTAFTEDHARLLKRYTDLVVLCYDGDPAGLAAADKSFKQLAAQGLRVKMMHLPNGEDPDSFLKSQGPEPFRALLDSAKDFFDAKLDLSLKSVNLSSPSEKAALTLELADSVASMSDPLTRDATIQTIAIRLRLGADDFRQVVNSQKQKNERFRRNPPNPDAPVKATPTPADSLIIYLCHLALYSEPAAEFLREQLESLDDCLAATQGSSLLLDILAKQPNPQNPSSIQAYLMTLPESDRLALEKNFDNSLPADPVSSAADAIAMLSAKHYQNQEKALRAHLSDPNLTPAEIISALQEIKTLQTILQSLDQRF